jgi:monoterpene epsilon-lactone hydrolase
MGLIRRRLSLGHHGQRSVCVTRMSKKAGSRRDGMAAIHFGMTEKGDDLRNPAHIAEPGSRERNVDKDPVGVLFRLLPLQEEGVLSAAKLADGIDDPPPADVMRVTEQRGNAARFRAHVLTFDTSANAVHGEDRSSGVSKALSGLLRTGVCSRPPQEATTMASPQAEAAKEMIRQFRASIDPAQGAPTLEQQRDSIMVMAASATEPAGVTVRETYAGGSRAYWHDGANGATDRVILYLHGGGYVIGSPKSHERLAGHLAVAVGCRVLNVDYRLAPEHPHPAAVEDAVRAYRWLLAQGFEPGHIAISGDSAGGGLTLATLLALKEQGLPQPAAAVPLSPWTDLEGTGASMDSNAEADLMVGRVGLQSMAGQFLGEGNPRDPLAAPLHGDYAGIAPLYIQVGGDETLLDDSLRVAEKARAAGCEVKLDVFPEMQHVFQASVGNMPEATDAVQRIGVYLREKLGL